MDGDNSRIINNVQVLDLNLANRPFFAIFGKTALNVCIFVMNLIP